MDDQTEAAPKPHVEIGVFRHEGGRVELVVDGTSYCIAREDAARLGNMLHAAAGSAFQRTGHIGRATN